MFDIIILALLAGFILLRLRAELGKKNDDLPPPRPLDRQLDRQSDRNMSGRGRLAPVVESEAEVIRPASFAQGMIGDAKAEDGLAAIKRKDRHFDAADFLGGAEQAYRMILEAFWSGDRETLSEFLDKGVLAQFGAAIEQREAEKLTLKNKVVDVESAKFMDATLDGKQAEITVAFTAQIISATLDEQGKLLEGDLSDAIEIKDNWTFSRDLASSDPTWTLIATRTG